MEQRGVSFPPPHQIAAGHIGEQLQFPRARRSRDRTAERAIRGGGEKALQRAMLEKSFTRHSRDRIASHKRGGLRSPVIIVAPTSRARAFGKASQLGLKKDCGP